jgi:hypothetical protein
MRACEDELKEWEETGIRPVGNIGQPPLEFNNTKVQDGTLFVGRFGRSFNKACRMRTGSDLANASWWRWLLFFASVFPLDLLGLALANLITLVVMAYGLGGEHVRSLSCWQLWACRIADLCQALCPLSLCGRVE